MITTDKGLEWHELIDDRVPSDWYTRANEDGVKLAKKTANPVSSALGSIHVAIVETGSGCIVVEWWQGVENATSTWTEAKTLLDAAIEWERLFGKGESQ